jgi:putative aldouronate transport system permease protein
MSILRVLVGTITQHFATGLLSYIIIIRWFSGRRFIRVLFLITMYIGGGLIPYYLLLLKLGLTNTFQVYWIPSLFNAYYMLLISSYMQNIPESLFESARIDGASEFLIYICLAIPTCIPVLAAVAVYIAIGHWNSWFDVTIYNPNGKFDTLQVFLRRLILEAEAYQKMQESEIAVQKVRAANLRPKTIKAATTMVATIPIILVYPFFQRYFVRGITLGSVKE